MSAVSASSAASGSVMDPVRALQHALYRAAKADPGRRFHALGDKVHRRDVLERAWEDVRRNRRRSGYRPDHHHRCRGVRGVPAAGRGGRDVEGGSLASASGPPGVHSQARVVGAKAAVDSFGRGPGCAGCGEDRARADLRGRHVGVFVRVPPADAPRTTLCRCSIDESWRGRRWVVETDIANCFEAIPHEGLIRAVQERVSDRSVLKLLRAMLRAGVMSDGQVRRSVTGTPQGGVISPLMANVYLHRIDRAWNVRQHGVLVRFADDVVVMCTTREQAEAALAQLRVLLAELGLEPKAAKTRIVELAVGGPGFDFLGFHHRLVRSDGRRSGKHVTFLARWPSNKAMQHARDRIRELTDRSLLLLPVEAIVMNVNRFVRGWAAYFRYGNSTRHFDKIKGYMRMRLALVISKRHKRSRAFGRSVVFFQSPNHLGLVGLDGIVAAPRPFRAWRVTPNAGGERRR